MVCSPGMPPRGSPCDPYSNQKVTTKEGVAVVADKPRMMPRGGSSDTVPASPLLPPSPFLLAQLEAPASTWRLDPSNEASRILPEPTQPQLLWCSESQF